MADVHSKKTRSYNMSRIRSKNTKPEITIRKFLFANGYRFRLHSKKLPGKPDLVLKTIKTAIFVHGCFWHGHKNCKYYIVPKTRTKWWLDKINRNQINDRKKKRAIENEGWKAIEIWECELKAKKKEKTLKRLLNKISR